MSIARLVAAAAIAGALGATPAGAATDARLQGTFTMQGRITVAHDVYNEYRGQLVTRTWSFFPSCSSGICQAVTLQRQRSEQNILDTVVLKRRAAGVYVGRGSFWVPLYCAGHVRPHGGLAFEKITVRITQVDIVDGVPYATALSANYLNKKRVNLTACPGGIGHDAAKYTGQLSSTLP